MTFYLLIAMELKSRRVHFAGCTPNPNEAWMKQVARNLNDSLDGFLSRGTYLQMDRDSKYCQSFRGILERAGVKPVKLPAKSPNLNDSYDR